MAGAPNVMSEIRTERDNDIDSHAIESLLILLFLSLTKRE